MYWKLWAIARLYVRGRSQPEGTGSMHCCMFSEIHLDIHRVRASMVRSLVSELPYIVFTAIEVHGLLRVPKTKPHLDTHLLWLALGRHKITAI